MFFIDLANTCNEKYYEGISQFLNKDANVNPYRVKEIFILAPTHAQYI
jgi:hypothetical protein